jgi:hypothetical protein
VRSIEQLENTLPRLARLAAEAALPKTASNSVNSQTEATKAAVASGMKTEPTTGELDARNEVIARLQSEIRVLKILLNPSGRRAPTMRAAICRHSRRYRTR